MAGSRSSFHVAQKNEVEVQCKKLITGLLQQHATEDNITNALEFCQHRFHDHQFADTNEAAVGAEFAQLLEKFHVHSQVEAAELLEDRHRSFMACRLSQRHTIEPHAAVLRALLLLARRPTDTQLRAVRTLRAIGDRKQAAAVERRRSINEKAHERKVLLELELRQVVETASREWSDAWAFADPDPFDSDTHDAGEGSPKESREKIQQHSGPDVAESPGYGAAAERHNQDLQEFDLMARVVDDKATFMQKTTLPNGSLPRPPWLQLPKATMNAGVVAIQEASGQAVVEAALHMLSGHCGDLVQASSDGTIRWQPVAMDGVAVSLRMRAAPRPPKAVGAVTDALGSLSEFGSALMRLRALAELLQALAPPVFDQPLHQAVCATLSKGSADSVSNEEPGPPVLSLRQICRLIVRHKRQSSRGRGHLSTSSVQGDSVLGLCWQSFGLVLEDLLQDLDREVLSLHARFHESNSTRPLTLLGLCGWSLSRRRAAMTVEKVVDAALSSLSQRCHSLEPERWPEAAAEELIAHLARAARDDGLTFGGLAATEAHAGNQGEDSSTAPADEAGGRPKPLQAAWLGALWQGAMRPVLRAVDQWGSDGELFDPCGEFRDVDETSSRFSALLPLSVASAGRQLRALRGWGQSQSVPKIPSRVTTVHDSETARSSMCGGPPPTELAAWRSICSALPVAGYGRSLDIQRDSAEKMSAEAHRFGSGDVFIPLETALAANVLGPTRKRAEDAARPLLARVLTDGTCGLLRHLEAIRSIALLERDDIAEPLVRRCLVARHGRSAMTYNALGVELSAALSSEGDGPPSAARQLCARHLSIELLPTSDAQARSRSDSGAVRGQAYREELLCGLRLGYAATAPLDRVLDTDAMRAYSALMALLLRLRHAQATLLEIHRHRLFGVCGGARRCWPTRLQPGSSAAARRPPNLALAKVGRASDLFRAEISHFLACLEWYVRIDVLQEATRAFERQVQELAQVGNGGTVGSFAGVGGTEDVMDRARNLHHEYLYKVSDDCFLSTEFRPVLVDIEELVGAAAKLHEVLEALETELRPTSFQDVAQEPSISAAIDDGRSGTGAGLAEDLMDMDFDSPIAERVLNLANAQVIRMQMDFQRKTRFLMQVLNFSIARGTGHKVGSFCSKLDFTGYYCGSRVPP